ncbi:MAG: sensor histidine kinase [Arenicella sp.]
MIKKNHSIRFRLIVWLVLPLALLSLMTLGVMSYLITNQATNVFDRSLLAAANSIEKNLGVRNGQVYLHKPYFVFDIMESVSGEKVFYRIERSGGKVLAGFKGLKKPKEELLIEGEPIFYNTQFAGNELRAVYLPVFEKIHGKRSYTHIILAESLHSRNAFVHDILVILIGMTLLGGSLSIFVSIFAVTQGLKPLNRIQQSLIKRSADDLAPLQGEVPQEAKELVLSINSLMDRVRQGIEHIQHFNSDVSHQLRTPLAEIKALAEISKRESNNEIKRDNLHKIEDLTNFLVRTTQQLLAYSKTNNNAIDKRYLETLDLVKLCQNISSSIAPKIYKSGQELAFIAVPEGPHNIVGDPIMLEGLLINLLENASLYAVNQQGLACGTITIRSKLDNNWVTLEVEDQGPGVPESLLPDVTQRFYRLSKIPQGSGLGLTIVKQISDLHNAKMQLKNVKPHGLKVSIRFNKAQ